MSFVKLFPLVCILWTITPALVQGQCPSGMILNIIGYTCDPGQQTYDVTFTLATNEPVGNNYSIIFRNTSSTQGPPTPACVEQYVPGNPACDDTGMFSTHVCACNGLPYTPDAYVDFFACTGLNIDVNGPCDGTFPVEFSLAGIPLGLSVGVSTNFSYGSYPDLIFGSCNYTVFIPSPPTPATPGNIAGKVSVCAGETAIYSTAAVPNATSYTWEVPPGATLVSGQGTNSITVLFGAAGGDVCVTANGDCAASAATCKTVAVQSAPVVDLGPDKTFCEAPNLVLDAGNTGSTFAWSTGASTQTININSPGTYTVTVTQGGCSVSDAVVVTQSPAVQIGAPVTNGLSGAFVLSGGLPQSDGSNYASVVMQLQGNPAVTATLTTPPFTHNETVSFTCPQPGTYLVTATDAGGCSATGTITIAGNGNGNPSGSCWELLPFSASDEPLTEVFFTDDQTGWVVSFTGKIFNTADGGQTWTLQNSGTTAPLWHIFFSDMTTGWAVGNNGTILKTADGGQNWAPQLSGTSYDLLGAFFINNQTGWVVGEHETILKTTDGGQTWITQMSTGLIDNFLSVFFTDAQTGWVVGSSGQILHTTDGGANWTPQNSGTSAGLGSVYFTNNQTGWIVGWLAPILKTTDGGQTWVQQTPGTDILLDVHFTDNQIGWAVGLNGALLKTSDGGHNWTPVMTGLNSSLYGVHFVNAHTGWAVGGPGIVLRYNLMLPACIASIPLHQQTNVAVSTAITWPVSGGCENGYFLSLGTVPGGSDILNNQDVGNVTSFQPAQPLPSNATIYVRIVPYNGLGPASGCQEFYFSTAGGGGNINTPPPCIEWQKALGGSSEESSYAIHPTTDGGFISAGYAHSNDGDVTGHHGSGDGWITKHDSTGNLQWQKALGGSGVDFFQGVQQTADGGYVATGATYSNDGDVSGNHGDQDIWVVKLDPSGTQQWQKTLGGSAFEVGSAIIQAADGSYIVAGSTHSNDGQVSGNHGETDWWVVKLDALGNLIWQKTFGGSGADFLQDIQQTADSGYIATGSTYSNDGDVSGNKGSGDLWVVKLDAAGNIQWQKSLGGSTVDFGYAIAPCDDGGFIINGTSNSNDGDVTGNHGSSDFWVIKLDFLGNLQWQRTLGGSGEDNGYPVFQTSDGGFIAAGATLSTDDDVSGQHGSSDAWVVKLDASGQLQWQKAMGGTDSDKAYDIAPAPNGGIFLAGQTASDDGDVSGNHGGGDQWIVKLNTCSTTTCTGDSLRLVEFFNATNGPNWTRKDNWLVPGKPISSWYGVGVTADGCVGSIYLGKNNLNGPIPESFGNFSGLESIDLQDNGLSGELPASLGNLTKMEFFYVPSNLQLSGTLPPGITNWSNVSMFSIANTAIGGSLPPDIDKLKKLRYLLINNTQISGELPAGLADLPDLIALIADNCRLSGPAPDFSQSAHLQILAFPKNKIDYIPPGAVPLPTASNTLHDSVFFSASGFGFIIGLFRGLYVSENALTFDDLLPWRDPYFIAPLNFQYAPQDSVFHDTTLVRNTGEKLDFSLDFDESVSSNIYRWYKNGIFQFEITGNNNFVIDTLKAADAGEWRVQVINPALPALTLYGRAIHLQVGCSGITPPTVSGPGTLCSGAATLTAPGNFTNWAWSNGQNGPSNSVTITQQGLYTVTVTDGNGCTATAARQIAGGTSAPTVNIISTATLCAGSANLSAPGNFVQWQWSTGQKGLVNSVVVAQAGTYTVTVTDNNGCTGVDTHTLSGNAALPVPVIDGPTSLCSGVATLTAQGAFSNWKWSNSQNGASNNITVNQAGVYTVTVTDANGCTGTDTHTLTGNTPAPAPLVVGPTVLCNGNAVSLDASGAGFTDYLWSDGSTTPAVTISTPGLYTVVVRNAAGCTGTASVAISDVIVAPPVISGPTVICGGPVTLNAGAGYDAYLWSNGATTQQINAASAGDYWVEVTRNGCSASDTVTVSTGATLLPLIAGQKLCGGSAVLDAGPGYATYLWSNGANTQQIAVTQNGTYTVTVTLAGCNGSGSYTVQTGQPVAPPPTISGPDVFCGAPVTLDAGAGYAAYRWSNGANTQQITVAGPGSYSVTVYNNDSCSAVAGKTLLAGTPPPVTVTGLPIICGTQAATVQVTQVYPTYTWSDGQMSQQANFSQPSTYTVTVTDAGGCTNTATVGVAVGSPMVVDLGPDIDLCSLGLANVTLDAGPAQSYQWSVNKNTQTITVAQPGDYSVSATNSSGCSGADTVSILKAPLFTEIDTVLCPGEIISFCGFTIGIPDTVQCTFTTLTGCDSTVTLRVQAFTPPFLSAIHDSVILPLQTLSVEIDVTDNDAWTGNFTLYVLQEPTRGKAEVINNTTLLYTLNQPDFYGTDSLQYALCPPAVCPDTCAPAWVYLRAQAGSIDKIKALLPNAITPNDDGSNDVFDPVQILADNGVVVQEAELTVFNRWGEVVHRNLQGIWDGRYNGRTVPSATYYYRLRIVAGKEYFLEGSLHIF